MFLQTDAIIKHTLNLSSLKKKKCNAIRIVSVLDNTELVAYYVS